MAFPRYPSKPHQSGQARIVIRGNTYYLGKFESALSYIRYAELRQIEEKKAVPPTVTKARTVSDVIAAFHDLELARYSEHEQNDFRLSLRPVAELYGLNRIDTFGPLELRRVRQHMSESVKARKTINQRIGRIVRVWRWAVSHKLISSELWQDLNAVPPISPGSEAENMGVVDYEEVPPVPEDDLHKTIAECHDVLKAMIWTQLLTAARPGEVCQIRYQDIHTEGTIEIARGVTISLGNVWAVLYRARRYVRGKRTGDPQLIDNGSHKTAHRDHNRVILIGPRCKAVLEPFIQTREPSECLFSPRDAWLLTHDGKMKGGKRQPSSQYTTHAYGHAILKAINRAGVPRWSPHQLRHNAATRLNDEFGPEIARIILGHRSLAATRTYVQDGYKKAIEVIEKIG